MLKSIAQRIKRFDSERSLTDLFNLVGVLFLRFFVAAFIFTGRIKFNDEPSRSIRKLLQQPSRLHPVPEAFQVLDSPGSITNGPLWDRRIVLQEL